MEFNEKLQKLRTNEKLTQEELAEKLYVSRTAISKWESGRGYPNIDSLKAIAKFFHITIDELIGGEEMITLAEKNIEASNKKHLYLICGMLDCLTLLLLFLPVFGDGGTEQVSSVPVTAMTSVSGWLKTTFSSLIGITVIGGFAAVSVSSLDKPAWSRRLWIAGTVLSILGSMLFILSRQPYAGLFYLCILVTKGFLMQKSK